MTIFIDGDAFPNLLKPIVLRAINKQQIKTYVISNKKITIGESQSISYVIVDTKADEADDKIVQMLSKDDLVITADIPLASRVIDLEAHAIDHRGDMYTKDNVKQYLAIRNLMQSIRDSGELTKDPAPFGQKDAQMFANSINSFLQKYNKIKDTP